MCGFVGACVTLKNAEISSRIDRALGTLRHRGPDSSGYWRGYQDRVHLGHQRLAILDLNERSDQPMSFSGGEVVVVYNGEIYNFKELRGELEAEGYSFRTESDTEVVGAAYLAWSDACWERFHGMFAIGIVDLRDESLTLARDRAGEKPLVFLSDPSGFFFASEAQAVLSMVRGGAKISTTGLAEYLRYGFTDCSRPLLEGLRRVPPAGVLKLSLQTGTIATHEYWQPPGTPADVSEDTDGIVDELDAVLRTATREVLRSDVPVAILLSGGLDSSLVAALVAEMASDVAFFSVRAAAEGDFDETEHASLVAGHLGKQLHVLEGSRLTPQDLEIVADGFDEPIGDSSLLPTWLLFREIGKQRKVAVGGDGADELFGGYPHYSRLMRASQFASVVPNSVAQVVTAVGHSLDGCGRRAPKWVAAVGELASGRVPRMIQRFSESEVQELVPGLPHPTRPTVTSGGRNRITSPLEALDAAMRSDFGTYLSQDILAKVDRAAMAHSLEVRTPYLHPKVLDFAFGRIPPSLKIRGGQRKFLLGNVARRYLPPSFDFGRKQGFLPEVDDWFRGGVWKSFAEDLLLGDQQGVFNRRFITKMMQRHSRQGKEGERIFTLCIFELWRRRIGATL